MIEIYNSNSCLSIYTIYTTIQSSDLVKRTDLPVAQIIKRKQKLINTSYNMPNYTSNHILVPILNKLKKLFYFHHNIVFIVNRETLVRIYSTLPWKFYLNSTTI